jgi:hypothetical protein
MDVNYKKREKSKSIHPLATTRDGRPKLMFLDMCNDTCTIRVPCVSLIADSSLHGFEIVILYQYFFNFFNPLLHFREIPSSTWVP